MSNVDVFRGLGLTVAAPQIPDSLFFSSARGGGARLPKPEFENTAARGRTKHERLSWSVTKRPNPADELAQSVPKKKFRFYLVIFSLFSLKEHSLVVKVSFGSTTFNFVPLYDGNGERD